ncbi:MAG: DUF3857 domain-containing protein [Rikenellaceae bacterium]|nr:DUF3857 domain-containing protein [Rikenellaceae bacterium]
MKKILLSVVATTAFVFGAAAQPEATYNYLDKTYTLKADGSTELRVRSSLTYNTMSSFFSMFGETFIEYNPEFQRLTINECYTRQVDGTVIQAPANAFNEVLPRHSADAPAYNHLKEMVVTHTGLELGATAFLDYTITSSADMLGGELDFTEVVSQYARDVRKMTVTVNLPEGKTLRYGVVGADGKCAGERSLTGSHTWTWNKVKPFFREAGAPKYLGKIRLYATTLPSTADVTGRVFYDTRDMYRVDPKRTEGKQGEQLLNAVCDYVRKMVDLKDIPASLVGYRHAPARTVDARCYGSTLDKAFMLNKALLGEGFECDILLNYPADCPVYNLSGFDNVLVKTEVDGKAIWLEANGDKAAPVERWADRNVMVSMVTMAPVEVEHKGEVANINVEVTVDAEGNGVAKDEQTTRKFWLGKEVEGVRTLNIPSFGYTFSNFAAVRTEPFELYNTIDHSEVYTVTLEKGEFATRSSRESVSNAVGSASWEVAVNGNKATITHTLRVDKNIVWPSEWKQMRELLVLHNSTAALKMLVK